MSSAARSAASCAILNSLMKPPPRATRRKIETSDLQNLASCVRRLVMYGDEGADPISTSVNSLDAGFPQPLVDGLSNLTSSTSGSFAPLSTSATGANPPLSGRNKHLNHFNGWLKRTCDLVL